MKTRIQEIMQELQKLQDEVAEMSFEEKDNDSSNLLSGAEIDILNAIAHLNKYWES